jgi:hypothetical protein
MLEISWRQRMNARSGPAKMYTALLDRAWCHAVGALLVKGHQLEPAHLQLVLAT